MAASRREKVGSIFSRFTGLLRSGAITDTDKPVWYDVYQAFPPVVEPKLDRHIPSKEIPNLLYPEDIIRAQFYSIYGNPDVVDLSNETIKTTCQKLVEKFFELQETSDVPDEEIFNAAVENLKSEGIRLRTLMEKESELLGQSPESSSPSQTPAGSKTKNENNQENLTMDVNLKKDETNK